MQTKLKKKKDRLAWLLYRAYHRAKTDSERAMIRAEINRHFERTLTLYSKP
jgi:hypothetical protein